MIYKKISPAFIFSPPPKYNKSKFNSFSNSKGSVYKIDKKKLIGKVTSENALSKADFVLKTANFLVNSVVGNLILTKVGNGINSLTNNARSELPAYIQQSYIKNTVAEDTTKIYIVRFHVGLKSTQSVLDAERQHGSVSIELTNSLSDSIDKDSRGYLRRSFGFNMKSFDFLNEFFYVTVKDYNELILFKFLTV